MTFEQAFLLGLLAAIFALFVWGKWRYDVVAFLALLVATVAGMVPPAEAFLGFGHPATVTVGASCAFLTPIGHQNNTLILGPGGYHFGDDWRMGLPLEILILLIGVPMLLWIWPL